MPVWNFIKPSAYHDSVTLMRLTRDMEAVAGVTRAAAMMGTPPNRALLAGAALLTTDGERAGPTDLVIAVVADKRERGRRRAPGRRDRAHRRAPAPPSAGPDHVR